VNSSDLQFNQENPSGKKMATSNSKGIRISIHTTSSKQENPTKSSSKFGHSASNDPEQEQEQIGQGKLYAPPYKELGDGTRKTQLASPDVPDRSTHRKQSSISPGKLYSPELSVHVDAQKKNKREDGEEENGSGQGKLYSPEHALHLQTNDKGSENRGEHTQLWNKGKGVLEASRGVAADIRRSLSQVKDRVVDKLAAVPVPAEALDNARQSLESIIKDVTQAAQGLTKEAVHRIKVRLAEILPFLSPNQTGKIVDDVEREVMDMSEAPTGDSLTTEENSSSGQSTNQGNQANRSISASTTSSTVSPPLSFSVNMGHLTRALSLRSRL